VIYHGCPKCGEALSSPESLAGLAETCPACRNVTKVPPSLSAAPAAVATAPPAPRGPERVLWSGRPSRWHYAGRHLIGWLCLLFGSLALLADRDPQGNISDVGTRIGWSSAGLGGLLIVQAALSRLATGYRITTRQVTVRRGILSRRLAVIPLGPIREVTLCQGILDRLLNIGTVGFSTSASSGQEIRFVGIPGPASVQRLVQERLEQ
jgi:membrane protein YdbS with pleckstrin-like domain